MCTLNNDKLVDITKVKIFCEHTVGDNLFIMYNIKSFAVTNIQAFTTKDLFVKQYQFQKCMVISNIKMQFMIHCRILKAFKHALHEIKIKAKVNSIFFIQINNIKALNFIAIFTFQNALLYYMLILQF